MTTSTDPPPRRAAAPSTRRRVLDSSALLIGTGVNGLLAYAFFALATRVLGARDAAPVAQLWTWWSASAAILTFPVQHWVIRTVRTTGLAAVRRALPQVTVLVAGVATAVVLASWLGRQALFLQGGVTFPLLAGALTVGAFVVGLVRGRLAGADRFVATGAAIAGENAVRVLAALLVVAAGGGALGFGAALAVGGIVVVAWPSAFRFPPPGADGDGASPLVFLGGIAGGSLIAQLVLTGGPVVLATIGGAPAEITGLFTALALFRAPYLVTLGMVTQLTGAFTDMVVKGRHRTLRRVRLAVLAGTALGTAAAAAVGLWLGPAVIELIFGAGVAPPAPVVAVIAAATTVGLANLVFTVLLVAREASGALTTNWLIAVAAGAATIVALPADPLITVAAAFLVAEAAAFALMWWTDVRLGRAGVHADTPPPTDA